MRKPAGTGWNSSELAAQRKFSSARRDQSFALREQLGRVFVANFERPRGAVSAVIYLVKAGEGIGLISDPAISSTVITLPEPLPLYRRDWSHSPAWLLLQRLRAF